MYVCVGVLIAILIPINGVHWNVRSHESQLWCDCGCIEELIFYAVKELFIDDEPASEERLGTEPDASPPILSLPRHSV